MGDWIQVPNYITAWIKPFISASGLMLVEKHIPLGERTAKWEHGAEGRMFWSAPLYATWQGWEFSAS